MIFTLLMLLDTKRAPPKLPQYRLECACGWQDEQLIYAKSASHAIALGQRRHKKRILACATVDEALDPQTPSHFIDAALAPAPPISHRGIFYTIRNYPANAG